MAHSVPTAFVNAVGTEWVTPRLPRVPGRLQFKILLEREQISIVFIERNELLSYHGLTLFIPDTGN